MYLCMYICMCIYMCACMCMYACMGMCIDVQVYRYCTHFDYYHTLLCILTYAAMIDPTLCTRRSSPLQFKGPGPGPGPAYYFSQFGFPILHLIFVNLFPFSSKCVAVKKKENKSFTPNKLIKNTQFV